MVSGQSKFNLQVVQHHGEFANIYLYNIFAILLIVQVVQDLFNLNVRVVLIQISIFTQILEHVNVITLKVIILIQREILHIFVSIHAPIGLKGNIMEIIKHRLAS